MSYQNEIHTTYTLLEMLKYKRPEGSRSQVVFNMKFIEPYFGEPDIHGNYIKVVNKYDGSSPNICFAAHHDTVHDEPGMQELTVKNEIVTLARDETSNCLGADCTTGIWLILNMIEACIPGVYVIHASEESGCQGSKALVRSKPDWLQHIESVISFDRYGEKSIITHQMGGRTASNTFAKKLSEILNMPKLKADSHGSYTDSNEYRKLVSECTNISVGYLNQHSTKESQNLRYSRELLNALLSADWSKLTFHRDQFVPDYDDYSGVYKHMGFDYLQDDFDFPYSDGSTDYYEDEDLFEIICDYPEEVASLLKSFGYEAAQLAYDLGIQETKYLNKYNRR